MNATLKRMPVGRSWARVLCAICLLTAASQSCGQIVSPIVAVRGVATRHSRLTNMSVGARPNDPINPNLPTFVITHGFNPVSNLYHLSNPEFYAAKLRGCAGGRINVLAFHWDSGQFGTFATITDNATGAGCDLANALIRLGVVPENLTMIGHSMGSVTVTSAANHIFQVSGRCTRRLVLLDAPQRRLPMIVGRLNGTQCAIHIVNVWAGGVTGIGAPVYCDNVTNVRAPNRRRLRWRTAPGPLRPSGIRHLDVLIWYYQTQLTGLLR